MLITQVSIGKLQSLHECAFSMTTRSCVCASSTQVTQQDLLAMLSTMPTAAASGHANGKSAHTIGTRTATHKCVSAFERRAN